MAFGVLVGFPLVDLKATLEDGAHHDVNPSEIASRTAGNIVFKKGARRTGPVILEPIVDVEVRIPERYMGDIIGDLNSRRGNIASMTDAQGVKVIRAKVPLSEMFGYIGDLCSKAQGRAMFIMQFDSYAEVPKSISEKTVSENRGA